MKKIRKILIPSIITILLVAIVAWKLSSNKKVMEEKAAIAETKTVVFPVTVVHSKSQLLNQLIEVNGVFNPNHSLNFLSELSGRIVQLSIREGQMVSKGQQIAKIDDEQLLIDIELATATLDKAKSDLIKYEGMLAGNAATKQQIEDFKMQVKSAEARLATLKRQLRATKIVSPISGVVNKLSLEVGSFVSPGASIAEILDISSLKMKASLLDRDVVRFKVGQTITVKPDLYPTSPRNGKITYIASKADASRNYSVEIELANSTKPNEYVAYSMHRWWLTRPTSVCCRKQCCGKTKHSNGIHSRRLRRSIRWINGARSSCSNWTIEHCRWIKS
jgi:multidrug efflux pump subunit AcrA (membrane-fusion protein)